jgi:hypothetical protein
MSIGGPGCFCGPFGFANGNSHGGSPNGVPGGMAVGLFVPNMHAKPHGGTLLVPKMHGNPHPLPVLPLLVSPLRYWQ